MIIYDHHNTLIVIDITILFTFLFGYYVLKSKCFIYFLYARLT